MPPGPRGGGPARSSSPTGAPATRSPSTPCGPTGRRSTTAPTASSATCGSPPTTTSCACTTGGSTAPPTARGWSPRSSWPPSRSSTGPRGSSRTGPATPSRPRATPSAGTCSPCAACSTPWSTPARRSVTLIETKHPTRHGSDVENTLVQVLRMFDLDGGDQPGRPQVRMMSFSNRALQRAHKLAPRAAAGLPRRRDDAGAHLGRHPAQGRGRRRARRADAAPAPRWSRPSSAAGTRSTSGPSTTTTDVDRCLELGVDVIITNRPGHVLRQVAAVRLGLAA